MILQQARGQINDIQQRKEGKGRKLESVIRSAETSVCDGESQEWQSQVGRVKMSSQNLITVVHLCFRILWKKMISNITKVLLKIVWILLSPSFWHLTLKSLS